MRVDLEGGVVDDRRERPRRGFRTPGHRLDLDACTQVSVDGERRYVCQMTEIIRASTQLSPRDPRHYWRDLVRRQRQARSAPRRAQRQGVQRDATGGSGARRGPS